VELLNSGATSLNLSGFYLSDDATDLLKWPFPASTSINGGAYRLVWLDNEPGETTASDLHAALTPSPLGGALVLTRASATHTSVVDYLHYPALNPDRAYGAFPDGTPTHRRGFYTATPGAPNDASWPATPVSINEWMAGNTATHVDPIDGDYDDWFELHNQAPEPLDLSGFWLTDDLTNPDTWALPPGTVIPANGFLLIWADDEIEQNGGLGLHAPFRLSLAGDSIGLFAPNEDLIDEITFGLQTNDISQGRWPDSNPNVQPLEVPTPNASNVTTTGDNHPPVLQSLSDQSGPELQLITFSAGAFDPDPEQALTFSLENAPAGASINPSSGVFTWNPSEDQGPSITAVTVRVTDNGIPPLSDTGTFTITVSEVNQPPILAPLADRAVDEETPVTFSAGATDDDRPAQSLTYSLDEGAPAGAMIDPNTGQFTWTPSEAQGPKTFVVTVIATDNGSPPLNSSQNLTLTVAEINTPPDLNPVADQTVALGNTLQITLSATDADQPANTITFDFSGSTPTGMSLDPGSGELSWTPAESDLNSTNLITVRASDNGSPSLNASTSFRVVVPAVDVPVLDSPLLNPDGSIMLRWSTQATGAYRLESTLDLSAPTWNTVTNLTASGTSLQVSLPARPEPQMFYRVVRE
jgi:hypothetical protein